MNKYILFFLLLGLTGVVGCQDDEHVGTRTETTLTIDGVTDSTWTYFSFVTGSVVGSSPLGDAQSDARWYKRTDWDIALCSDMIRTNSGTSGKGKGGIQKISNRNYNAITTAPDDGYIVDRPDIVIKR